MVNRLTTLLVAGITLNAVAATPVLRYNPPTSPVRFDGVKTPVLLGRDAIVPERRGVKPVGKKNTAAGASAPKPQNPKSMGSKGPGGSSMIPIEPSLYYSATQPAQGNAPVRRGIFSSKKKKTPAKPQKTKSPQTKKTSSSGGGGFDLTSAGMGMSGLGGLVNAGTAIYSATHPAPETPQTDPAAETLARRAKVRLPKSAGKPKVSSGGNKKNKKGGGGGLGGFDLNSVTSLATGGGMGGGGVSDLINLGTSMLPGGGGIDLSGMGFQIKRGIDDAPLELNEREFDEYLYDELD